MSLFSGERSLNYLKYPKMIADVSNIVSEAILMTQYILESTK